MLSELMQRSLLPAMIMAGLLCAPAVVAGLATRQSPPPAQQAVTVIWRDPGAVEQLDFAAGPGGVDGAPKPPFRFLEEEQIASNPKVLVEDASGVHWRAKWGHEVHSETFAPRIAWAAGYFVLPTYYVARGTIKGAHGLTRADRYIGRDGSFSDAVFERGGQAVTRLKQARSWAWNNNPFVGTKELNGLKVVMMLVSNWDSKDARDTHRDSNTAIFPVHLNGGVESRYLVTDWGGTMGKWGGFFSREKWDCKGFTSQTPHFTRGVKNGVVEFGYSGQHTHDIRADIRVSDVQWIMQYLGRITDEQLRAGLRAAGAQPEEVVCFTRALRDRLNQLSQVSGTAAP